MRTWLSFIGLAGAAAILTVSLGGCSKSIQATSGSKSFEPGAKRQMVSSRPADRVPPSAGSTSSPSAARPSAPSAPAAEPTFDRPPDQMIAAAEPHGIEPGPLPAEPMPLPPGDDAAAGPPPPPLSNVHTAPPDVSSRRSDEQTVPGDMLVAKTEPADSSRRRVEEMQREQLATAASGLEDVFFGFDSWQLSNEGKQTLMLDAEWLKANPTQPITIEGHCDERGTLAYNLVLGEKRAKAVQQYLIELGVQPHQLTVVSYGKERPFCNDHDELCYQKNRRGHLAVRP